VLVWVVLEQLLEQEDVVWGPVVQGQPGDPLVHNRMVPYPGVGSRNQTHNTAHLEERGIYLNHKVEGEDKELLCTDTEPDRGQEFPGSLCTVGEPGMDMGLGLGTFPLRRMAWSL